MKKETFEYVAEIKRQVGDFNIIKFPIDFWKNLNNLQSNDKVKITISKIK